MEKLTRENAKLTEALPIKVVQFGEGNFLRAFVDYVIDKMLNDQDGLYNLFMKGVKQGEEIQQQRTISCIQKGINPLRRISKIS